MQLDLPCYLLVTSGYLLVSSGYLVITFRYLIATTDYFSLLLVISLYFWFLVLDLIKFIWNAFGCCINCRVLPNTLNFVPFTLNFQRYIEPVSMRFEHDTLLTRCNHSHKNIQSGNMGRLNRNLYVMLKFTERPKTPGMT